MNDAPDPDAAPDDWKALAAEFVQARLELIRHEAREAGREAAKRAATVVVTMGCGDACPIFPGKRYEDWKLDDPAGQGVEAVRPIRDEIKTRIESLLADLIPAA